MPHIIDDETFQKAQARLEANRRGGKGAVKKLHPEMEIGDYWLSGKLYCGLCGGTLQGVSGTSKRGRLYYYYSCLNHRKHRCSLKNQRTELFEKIVLHTLDNLIHASAFRLLVAQECYAYYQKQNDDNGAYEASIKSQLKEVEGKLNNILKAIEAGVINNTTAERMNALERQKSMLNDELLTEQNRKKHSLQLSTIVKFLDGFIGDINDADTRRKLLDFFVDKIYVYPDKLVLSFYYSDDKRELPFEETAKLIGVQQDILSILNGPRHSADLPAVPLDRTIGHAEGNPGFFL